jgi:hypothetical protein
MNPVTWLEIRLAATEPKHYRIVTLTEFYGFTVRVDENIPETELKLFRKEPS